MNTFKRKALSCAILGGLGAAAGTAQAVYVDPSGQGQVLLYPYYTVQTAGGNAFNTYISVVNSTTRGKAVKVRFREGKNSREVLDFNLFLSPNDVWVAYLAADSATGPARVIVPRGSPNPETSCTSPTIGNLGEAFRNYAYVGTFNDNAGSGLDRTREGYFEILEMATVNNVAPSNLLTAITHGTTIGSTPANCSAVQSPTLSTDNGNNTNGTFTAPSGGLSGTYTLINVANGADFGGNAVALSNFTGTANYTDVGDETFNLASADPYSIVVEGEPSGATISTSVFAASGLATAGARAVSAAMMRNSIVNEWALDTAVRAATDWVITMPTKRFFVSTTSATTPFTNNFTSNGACEAATFNFFNREEISRQATLFSPQPVTSSGATLCWESTVLSIRNASSTPAFGSSAASGVLGSVNRQEVDVSAVLPTENGWARLTFTGTNATGTGLVSDAGSGQVTIVRNPTTGAITTTTTALPTTYRGLPVIGFMARQLNNATLTCTGAAGSTACQGSYGSLFDHKYTHNITP